MVTRSVSLQHTNGRSLKNMLDNPVGRMLLVILNTAISGSVSLLIYLLSDTTAPVSLKYATVSIIGLTAGFTSRRLLSNYAGLLRLLVAISAVIVSLLMLNVYSLGFIGIDLLPREMPGPDWDHLIQVSMGTIIAWLALYAWKSSKPVISTSPEPDEQSRLQLLPTRVGDWWNRVNIRLTDTFSSSRQGVRPRVNLRSGDSSNGRAGRSSLVKPRRRQKIFSWARRQDHQVQLSTDEEHRCPFCLEEVNYNDPRGVEICPICNTHHHADCWEVTGICQIPHFQD